MMEIYIEGKKLDVMKDDPSLLTFQVDDIKDFSSRNITFSKTIILPGTANNNYLFGSILNVQVQNEYSPGSDNVAYNFNPSVGADCLIFQNRLQVFKGTLRILEIVIDNGQIEYEVSVFGELGGLVAALGNIKLEDLDFSEYDHLYNATNITGSWENVTGGGYYYPLIDYGEVRTDKIDYDILYEAADVDGANPLVKFLRITLPMISPVILYNLVLSVIGLMQYFTVPYVMTRGTGNPGNSALFFNMYLYKTAFQNANMGYGATQAWFIFIIALVLTVVLFGTSNRWVYYASGD